MKRFFAFILASISVCLCFALSACGNGETDKEENGLEKVDEEQWKAAIENSRNAQSYSYNCMHNQRYEYISGEKRFNINSDVNGKIDNVNAVNYYEFFDNGSEFDNGDSGGFMFGKYYFYGEETYVSYVNTEGNFGEWHKEHLNETLGMAVDILNYITGNIFPINDEMTSLADLYDEFALNEENCTYSAEIDYSDNIGMAIEISFKNGKIYNVDWTTKNYMYRDTDGEKVITAVLLFSYSFNFFDYGNTVVPLPEELKNL